MEHRKVAKNRIVRQDDSGTFYRDIAFVPSGTLAMKEAARTSTVANKQEEAVGVREFYKAVLAMPRTVAQARRKKMKRESKNYNSTAAAESAAEAAALPLPKTMVMSSSPSASSPPKAKAAEDSGVASPIFSSAVPDVVPRAPVTSLSVSTDAPEAVEAAEIIRRNWQASQTESGSETTRIVAEGHVLCESCQIEVREDDLDRHRRGTAHLMSEESHIKPLDTLAIGQSNKGFRMLVNSGWDYEKGLGVDGQGARHPVATRLKHDRLALGAAGASKKLVTHTFEEIERSRTKPTTKLNRRVLLSLEDHRRKAEKERRDRVRLMNYMKK